jgi:Trypsin-like peptidase domain
VRQGLGAGAVAATIVALASFAVDASPPMTGNSPSDPVSSRISLLHQVLIYAKDGSRKLVDGRWNLSQSESKLGIALSTDETKQLMACTGKIVCEDRGDEVFASGSSVLRPDLLVTAKHVFSKGRGGAVSFGRCSFRSFLHRNVAIPIVVEKDQRKGYFLNNEDFIVVRLKRELEGCNSFAINDSDSSLSEGEEIFSATSYQRHTLNKISGREPVLAKGTIRSASEPLLGGVPFYYADIDLDEGGSGGAVFALKDGRPVADDEGRLILRGILVAYGPRAKNGMPYSEERNYTIINGLQTEFRDLVEGKADKPATGQPAPCLQGGTAKITVISESVPLPPSETLSPFLQQDACSHEATPDSKAGKANATCAKLAKELKQLAKGIETLAAPGRVKGTHQFKLRNDTSCPVCFTYNRCNDYGCWDEVVMASGKSTLFAGVGERGPVIKNPQFCTSGPVLADVRPPLPPRKPALAGIKSPAADVEPPPALPLRKPEQTLAGAAGSREQAVEPEAMFLAAKQKAKRDGVWTLTAEDIRGLSLEQIKELRGY